MVAAGRPSFGYRYKPKGAVYSQCLVFNLTLKIAVHYTVESLIPIFNFDVTVAISKLETHVLFLLDCHLESLKSLIFEEKLYMSIWSNTFQALAVKRFNVSEYPFQFLVQQP